MTTVLKKYIGIRYNSATVILDCCYSLILYDEMEVLFITRTIYIDILIATNFVVNYFILLAVAKCRRLSPNQKRLLTGSFTGALFSLVILLPSMGVILGGLVKIIISAVIIVITFGYHSIKALLKNTALFYLISFAFCGVMLFIWFIFTPKGLAVNNSVVYFNISPTIMIATTLFAYIVIRVCDRLINRNASDIRVCKVKLIHNSAYCEFYGKVDTGNTLYEPFSRCPVIVVNESAIRSITDNKFAKILNNNEPDYSVKNKYRVIPFNTIGANGLLPAFSPDEVYINDSFCSEKIYVAVCKNDILCGEIKAMVNPEIIEFVKE
ncbi:MAG: sigma-E processing peptidase SpoIIGA [Acutalibacteraceae bacterium]|nr:sigma-E processing peptidase SpoIIGA [Acutalibacteraceae bacterium]